MYCVIKVRGITCIYTRPITIPLKGYPICPRASIGLRKCAATLNGFCFLSKLFFYIIWTDEPVILVFQLQRSSDSSNNSTLVSNHAGDSFRWPQLARRWRASREMLRGQASTKNFAQLTLLWIGNYPFCHFQWNRLEWCVLVALLEILDIEKLIFVPAPVPSVR